MNKKGHKQWYNHNDNWYCAKFNNILFKNPLYTPRRQVFKGKQILLSTYPRKGICQQCGKTNCKTDLHHIKYHDSDTLKDTVELCVSCHKTEHWRLLKSN